MTDKSTVDRMIDIAQQNSDRIARLENLVIGLAEAVHTIMKRTGAGAAELEKFGATIRKAWDA